MIWHRDAILPSGRAYSASLYVLGSSRVALETLHALRTGLLQVGPLCFIWKVSRRREKVGG